MPSSVAKPIALKSRLLGIGYFITCMVLPIMAFKWLLEVSVRNALMTIDRRVLGVDVTIGRVQLLPRIAPIAVALHDVVVKNPDGFEEENLVTIKAVRVKFALLKLLWTVLKGRRVIEIKGISLTKVDVTYELSSPELGLKNSNVYAVVKNILGLVRRIRSATPASTEAVVNVKPSFQLRVLETLGFTATLYVDGVDLPIEGRLIPITDLCFTDFMHELRQNILKRVSEARSDGQVDAEELVDIVSGIGEFASTDSEGGGISLSMEQMIGATVESINEQVLDQLKTSSFMNTGIIGNSFTLAAKVAEDTFNDLDQDKDGSVSPQEIAMSLWGTLSTGK